MMHDAKPYADYLSLGIWLGLCTAQDAIAWADSQAEQYSALPAWLIDLATCADQHPLDVLHYLDQVPGSEDLVASYRLLIDRLGQRYPDPLMLDDAGAIAQYHHLIWTLYDNQICDSQCLDLAGLFLQIDEILNWLDRAPQQDLDRGWTELRQAHRELLARGIKAA